MKSVSVRLTFADEDFYETHIAPRKFNNELPGLVLRLLTAYVSNEELAYEIDQFLDKDNEPEVYEARSAIMEALSRLNMLENTITQDIESFDASLDGSETEDSDSDDDFVVTDGNGLDISAEAPAEFTTPASLASSIEKAMGIQSLPEPDLAQPTAQQVQPVSAPTETDSQIDKILSALSAITGQVSQLTSTVNTLVSSGMTPAMQVQQPMMAQQPMMQPQMMPNAFAVPQQPVQQVVQPAPVQPAMPQQVQQPVMPQQIQQPVPNVQSAAPQPVVQDLPFATSGANNPFANSQYAAIPVDEPSTESEDDDFEVPDFMVSALDNINK